MTIHFLYSRHSFPELCSNNNESCKFLFSVRLCTHAHWKYAFLHVGKKNGFTKTYLSYCRLTEHSFPLTLTRYMYTN